jgi:putative glutamine amidotransferase
MTSKKPLVGLNCRYETDQEHSGGSQIRMYAFYYQALIQAGALPLVVPTVEDRSLISEYLDILDGFVFTGGLDVPAAAYGENKHPQTNELHPRKFACDKLLAELLLEREMPVLAICLGLQLVNVAYGGTLIQHIETDIQHTHFVPGHDSFHAITVEEDSLLHRLLGASQLEVNSSHHQAVDKLGAGLRVLAQAPDGIVEAVQMTDRRFFIGVQWHPERILEIPDQRELFNAFVAAASEPYATR